MVQQKRKGMEGYFGEKKSNNSGRVGRGSQAEKWLFLPQTASTVRTVLKGQGRQALLSEGTIRMFPDFHLAIR